MIDRINLWYGEVAALRGALRDRLRREEGQAFVEYTLVILIVAVVLASGVFVAPFREAIEGAMQTIADTITGATDE